MMRTKSILGRWLATIGLATAVACSGPHGPQSGIKDNATPNEVPADPHAFDSQLKRYVGQTEFLNVSNAYYLYRSTSLESAKGGERAVQESDVFKVGRPGSKILYLLNDHRGLQVVSFAKGADQPELLGRVDATGNYPSDMYFDADHERLIVLERNWSEMSRASASRILIYDVKDPAHPNLAKTYDVQGEIAASRLVGSVLYVALAVWPEYGAPIQQGSGRVVSFSLADEGLKLVDSEDLMLPVVNREDMNIVATTEGEASKYYLVAQVSDSRWGFWDRHSQLEIVDISDAAGQIVPVMVVTAKGRVKERSSTHIKDRTLVVVSNYQIESGGRQILRAALETFAFPEATTTRISENEATYRRLHIERAMEHVPEGLDPDVYREQLVSDPTLGLKGVFVQGPKEKTLKPMADATLTTGDTTGLSADIRDVRFTEDRAYVFWVPQTMIDPLDVFDLKAVRTKPAYLGRTYFDGWVERAVPLRFEGKEYVLGLGWVVPAVGPETRRVPQVALFAVEPEGSGVASRLVSQMSLKDANVWINFASSDKYVETKLGVDGRGMVLFQIAAWGERYVSGGKLVGFDLTQIASGKVFTEGAVLAADSAWLRRVFTNPEIDRINTFSNEKLGVFAANEHALGLPSELMEAVGTLELARNVEAYAQLVKGKLRRGVQIISEGNRWYSQNPSAALLRLVEHDKADAEVTAVLAEIKMQGSYVGHLVTRDNALLVLTSEWHDAGGEGTRRWQNDLTVAKISLAGPDATKLVVEETTTWTETVTAATGEALAQRGFMRRPWYTSDAWQLFQLASGRVLAGHEEHLHAIMTPEGRLTNGSVALTGPCLSASMRGFHPHEFGRQLYVGHYEIFAAPAGRYEGLIFTKHFESPVTETAAGLTCGKAVNVPGELEAVVSDDHWVAEDQRILDIVPHKYQYPGPEGRLTTYYSYQLVTARVLTSMRVTPDASALVAMYGMGDDTGKPVRMERDRFAVIESQASRYDAPNLAVIGFDHDLRFTKETFGLDPSVFRGWSRARLVTAVPVPHTLGAFYGVVSHNETAAVIGWSTSAPRPTVKPVAVVLPDFARAAPTATFRLSGYGSWWDGRNTRPAFDPESHSFILAQGWAGLRQVEIAH